MHFHFRLIESHIYVSLFFVRHTETFKGITYPKAAYVGNYCPTISCKRPSLLDPTHQVQHPKGWQSRRTDAANHKRSSIKHYCTCKRRVSSGRVKRFFCREGAVQLSEELSARPMKQGRFKALQNLGTLLHQYILGRMHIGLDMTRLKGCLERLNNVCRFPVDARSPDRGR